MACWLMSQVYFTVKLIRSCIGPCAREDHRRANQKRSRKKTVVVSVQTEALTFRRVGFFCRVLEKSEISC